MEFATFNTATGQMVSILHRAKDAKACVVLLQPFAEEMNRSRRNMAIAARELSAAGFHVIVPDLTGTGDSDGELCNANLDIWLGDIAQVSDWMASEYGLPIHLAGLRLGANIAVRAAANGRYEGLFLWSPIADTKRYLHQLLRVHAASQSARGRAGPLSISDLEDALANGKALRIAGYDLTPSLADDVRALGLPLRPLPNLPSIICIDLVARVDSGLAPRSQRLFDAVTKLSTPVHRRVFSSPPFWDQYWPQEVVGLGRLTLEMLQGEGGPNW